MKNMTTDVTKPAVGRPAGTGPAAPLSVTTQPREVFAPVAHLVQNVALHADIAANAAVAAAATVPAAAVPRKIRRLNVDPRQAAPVAAAAAVAATAAVIGAVVVDETTVGYIGAAQRRPVGQWAEYINAPFHHARLPAAPRSLTAAQCQAFPQPGPSTRCHDFFWEDEFTPTNADERVDRMLVCQWCSATGDCHECKDSHWKLNKVDGTTRCTVCDRRK